MKITFHPLVQKTQIELLRLDKLSNLSWEEQKKYNSEFLSISVEPKLRPRALKFMNTLVNLLEANNHSIKFEYNRCHIEMYGQLTEIHLRQKYFRRRIKNSSGYSTDTYEKSNKLEFQIGYHARKGWIDKKTKKLEDYLPVIYNRIEKESKKWDELRKRQRAKEKADEIQRKLKKEKDKLVFIENEKLEKLFTDVKNYKKASEIRSYLIALEKFKENTCEHYLKWAYEKADNIDPLKSNKKLKLK